MRNRIYLWGIVLLVLCVVLVLFCAIKQKQPALHETQLPETNQTVQSEQPKALEWSTVQEKSHSTSVPEPVILPPQPYESTPSNDLYQQRKADWEKPIEFYGKVVDENGNPVEGAIIQFRWSGFSDDIFTTKTNSDSEGLFSLQGKQGGNLDVSVGKEGYYAAQGGRKSFLYSVGNDIYSPDPQDPVVFLLHRKGQGVELLTSEHGFQPKVDVRIPKDGTPVRVDLLQKQAGATGQLEISQNKPPWQGATNWSFRMSIPDGGLVENQDEFQFEAPERNYLPIVDYQFSKAETNWTTQVSKQFYITFGQPRKYGWLRIESNIAQETIFLTYAINPSGSRNLEPAN